MENGKMKRWNRGKKQVSEVSESENTFSRISSVQSQKEISKQARKKSSPSARRRHASERDPLALSCFLLLLFIIIKYFLHGMSDAAIWHIVDVVVERDTLNSHDVEFFPLLASDDLASFNCAIIKFVAY
jgi:hypothetical protein